MQVLPFYRLPERMNFNHPALYNVGRHDRFQIATRSNELLPFMCPLPDNWNGTLNLVVRKWPTGQQAIRFTKQEFNHRIVKNSTGRYLVYDGGAIGCMDLDVCGYYYLQINNFYSEVFSSIREEYGYLKFTLSSRTNVAGLPYDSKFTQYFYTKGFLPPPDYDNFTITSTDESGAKQTTYSRQTPTYTLDFIAVPPSIQSVFASLSLVEQLVVTDIFGSVSIDARQAKVKVDDKTTWTANLSLTLPDARYFDTNNCINSAFVEDSEFAGVSGAGVCSEPSGLDIPEDLCLDLIAGVDVECDPAVSDLNFILVVKR